MPPVNPKDEKIISNWPGQEPQRHEKKNHPTNEEVNVSEQTTCHIGHRFRGACDFGHVCEYIRPVLLCTRINSRNNQLRIGNVRSVDAANTNARNGDNHKRECYAVTVTRFKNQPYARCHVIPNTGKKDSLLTIRNPQSPIRNRSVSISFLPIHRSLRFLRCKTLRHWFGTWTRRIDRFGIQRSELLELSITTHSSLAL
jgi:hypothetical protein